jgi:hypothetical protein
MTGSPSRGSSRLSSLTAHRLTSWLGRALVAAAFLLHALRLVDSSWAEPGALWPGSGGRASLVCGLLEGSRYLAVAVEVLGAGLLFVPGCTAVGALLLSGTAFVTLFAHVFFFGGDTLGPLLLFIAGAVMVGRRRRELIAIWRVHTRTHRPSVVPARPR